MLILCAMLQNAQAEAGDALAPAVVQMMAAVAARHSPEEEPAMAR